MKLKLHFFLLSFVLAVPSLGQYGYNLNFESFDKRSKTFIGWSTSTASGMSPTNIGYLVIPDSRIKEQGRYSLRIESDPNSTDRTFGSVTYNIPTSFEGKRIQLKGFIKTQDVDTVGFASLWLRLVDSNGIMIGMDYMEDRKINGTNDWMEYSIDLPLEKTVRQIWLGGIMAGSGKVWFDNLRLFIDDVDVSIAKPKAVKTLREPANEFVNGSGIELGQLTPQKIRDLSLLAKVWGFLKYHHPAVAEARYHWDSELFKIMPSYLSVHDSLARDQLLIDWIAKLGPVSNCSDCSNVPKLEVKQKPDLSWIEQTSPSLQSTLNDVLANRDISENYYVRFVSVGGNPIFQEYTYEYFLYPDDGYRILALFRYWNMIQYYYPYKYAIGENWYSTLTEFIPKFHEAKNALQYRLTALELIGHIHDSHANLWGRDTVMINYKGRYIAPIKTRFVQDKLVVSDDVYAGATNHEIQIGDIITAVDQIPVDQYIKDNIKYYPASNFETQLRNISRDILRTKNQTLDLSIQNDNGTSQIKISTIPFDDYDHSTDYAWNYNENCCYLLNSEVGYINLGTIKDGLLQDTFNNFKSTKGIIVDIRNYPGGFDIFKLTNYLRENTRPVARYSVPDINQPGQFLLTPATVDDDANKNYYKGRIIVLVNEITQSKAEFSAMALQACGNTTVIGSTTAGADGATSRFVLPGNLVTMITGIGIYYPDGRETQRIGIVPDIIIKPTIQGIRERRDELIEKAQSIIMQP